LKGPFSALHPYAKKYPFRVFLGLFVFFLLFLLAADGTHFQHKVGELVMVAWLFALGFLGALRFLFK
jgi:K+ transporter